MKRKIAVILSAFILTSQAFAASVVNEPVYDNGMLTVAGTSDKANMPVRLEVFNNGVEYSAAEGADYENLSDIYMNVYQINANEDGSFEFSIPVSEALGNYLIRVGFFGGELIEKSYATYTEEELNAAVEAFIANPDKNPDELKQLVEGYYSGLGVNYSDLKSLSDEDAALAYSNIVNEVTVEFTKEMLIQSINKEIAVRQISRNADVKLIESYAAVLEIVDELYYQDFLKLSDEKKEELAKKCEGVADAAAIGNVLKNAVILDDISESLWNETYSVLTRYNEYLNIDFTKLNKIPENSVQRKNIMSDLKTAVTDGTVTDISLLGAKLEELIKKYPYSAPTTGNNGGGGGGGGSTGGGGGSSSVSPGSKAPVSSTEPVYTGGVSQEEVENPFDDLADYSWAEAAIVKLHELGIVNGKSEKIFDPAGNITREEYTAMIVRGFGFAKGANTAEFYDLTANRWSFDAVCTAVSHRIVNGYENGMFLPEENIIRQDMAVIAKRAALAAGAEFSLNEKVTFSDISEIEEYALESVNSLAGAGVINGKGGAFVPKGVTSRAEAAVVIYRILDFCGKI